MKAKTISVSYGRTVNLQNFNSLRFDVTIELEMEEGDQAKTAIEKATHRVKQEVESAILASLNDISEQRDAIFNSMKGK